MSNVGDIFKYGRTAVGTSAVRVPLDYSDSSNQGILMKSLDNATKSNTDTIYVGDAGVTADTGFPIDPGEAITLPISHSDVYAISGTANQHLAWIVV